jgi:hypothetical protein
LSFDPTDGGGKGSSHDAFRREMQLYYAPSRAAIDPEKNSLSRLAVQRRASGGAQADPAVAQVIRLDL